MANGLVERGSNDYDFFGSWKRPILMRICGYGSKTNNEMKNSYNFWHGRLMRAGLLSVACAAASVLLTNCAPAGEPPKDKAAGEMVPLDLKLPQPAFKGTPKDQ